MPHGGAIIKHKETPAVTSTSLWWKPRRLPQHIPTSVGEAMLHQNLWVVCLRQTAHFFLLLNLSQAWYKVQAIDTIQKTSWRVICITSRGKSPRGLYTRLPFRSRGKSDNRLLTSTVSHCRGGWVPDAIIHDLTMNVNFESTPFVGRLSFFLHDKKKGQERILFRTCPCFCDVHLQHHWWNISVLVNEHCGMYPSVWYIPEGVKIVVP